MGDVANRQNVAVRAEAGQHRRCGERDVGMVPEGLALVDVGDVALDDGNLARGEGVEDRDRRVGEGPRIDDDPRRPDPVLVDPVDDLVLGVALVEGDREPERLGLGPAERFDIAEGLVPVDLGLALAEEVQVGAVEDQDGVVHGRLHR